MQIKTSLQSGFRRAFDAAWPQAGGGGIRNYLNALVVAVLVPLLALASLLALYYARAQQQIIETQRTEVVKHLSVLVDREIESVRGSLATLSVSPELSASTLERFRLHLAAAMPSAGRMVLSDASGAAVVTVPNDGSLPPDERVQSVFVTRQAAVSGFRKSAERGPCFIVSVPVFNEQRVDFALSAEVPLKRLNRLFIEAKLNPNWIAAIVDRKGVVLARSAGAEQYTGMLTPPAAIAVVNNGEPAGKFENTSMEGIETSTMFEKSAASGWTLFVAVPTEILHAPLRRAYKFVVAVGVALTALSLGLAYILGNQVLSAVRGLEKSALDVVQGRHVPVQRSKVAEFERVGKVFEYAAAIVGERQIDERKLKESEERQRLAIEAGSFGTWDLDVASGRAVWSPALFSLLGYDSVASQTATMTMWRERVHPEDLAMTLKADAAARADRKSYVSEYRIFRADTHEERWVRSNGQYYYDDHGKPIRMVGVLRDVTERKLIELTVRESEARYRSALVVGRMGSWETNFATGVRTWSPEALALFGISVRDGLGTVGGSDDEFLKALHPDDKHLFSALHETANTTDAFPAEYRITRPDGSVAWLAGRGQVFARTPDGKCHRIVSVMADVTDQKKSELHIRFLLREMSHRSKNLLAVVQSIATQTIRTSASLQDFSNRFEQRLQGLAASHDILVDQNWEGARLSTLVQRQLMPFVDPTSDRVEMSGPSVDLNSTAAQAVGLALHELATNAIKYGALSAPGGRISISWAFDGPDVANLLLCWEEKGGPVVAPPLRKGFGSTVVERMAPSSVSGRGSLEYAPTGLKWQLCIPATEFVVVTV